MKVVPTLSTNGWIRNAEEQLDKIITYYLSTNPSQTLLFTGHVVSMQYAIFQCGGDMDDLIKIVQADLTTVLTRYFPDGVSMEISWDYENSITSQVNITMGLSVMKDGKKYDLARAINGIDSSFVATQQALKLIKL